MLRSRDMNNEGACLLFLFIAGCLSGSDAADGFGASGGSDAEVVIPPGCDQVIPLKEFCPTPCPNWTTALGYVCGGRGTGPGAPLPPTIGECAHDYSITMTALDGSGIDFYSKDTLEFEGAVIRGVDGKRYCVGTIPSIEPCGSDPPPPCSTDDGTSDGGAPDH